MITDRDRIYQAAQKYLQKGQLDKAVAEYESLVQVDPSDLRALLKVGDLHVRLGNPRAATRAYGQVAESYAKDGFFLKAVAVYKQICNLDADNAAASEALAQLYQRLGLTADALAQWSSLSALHARAQRFAESLSAIERVRAAGEPADEVVLHWAEMTAKLGDVAAALRELQHLAQGHKEAGRTEAWMRVAERMLVLDPALAGLACNLARVYMDRGDAHAALLKLRLAFGTAPQDDETLGLLARAFEALGQVGKATQVLRELETQAAQRGQPHVRLRVLQQIVRLNPGDADAEAALMGLQEELQARRTGRAVADLAPPTGEGAQATAEGDVAKLVVEATIYHRYNLHRRALEVLDRVLAAAPDHAYARSLHAAYGAELAASLRRPQPEGPVQSARAEAQALAAPAQSAAAAFFADEPSVVQHARPRVLPTMVHAGEREDVDAEALDVDRLIAAAMPASAPGHGPALSTADALGALVENTVSNVGPGPEAAGAPSDPEVHYNLGVAYREMGLYDEAIVQFALAQGSARRAFDARHVAGLCALAARRPEQAAELLEQALAIPQLTAPQTLSGHYALGVTLRVLGDAARAQPHLRHVAQHSPDYRHAAALLQRAQSDELLDEAVGGLLQPPPAAL